MAYIRNLFIRDRIWIGVDDTTDSAGRTISAMVMGSMDHPEYGTYLVNYDQIARGNAINIADFVVQTFIKLFGSGN